MARRDFTLSFATRDQMAACDYVGMAGGNTTPDKVALMCLTSVFGMGTGISTSLSSPEQ